ncbi:Rieske 2Fe-2S domain-containing protein [Acidocella sp.]|uniref:Rieske (2Fe-2S) protein n=1 Tax=Acidocella sp. TaxID=50710 RepID=UPI00261522F1|nr:Rieske 2Fe-2S domain-containing protein [Acidocella sp.]
MSDEAVFVICRLDEVPNRQARGFLLVRRGEETPWPVLILRWGRHVFAYENKCPHQGTRLDWEANQFIDGSGEFLICGKHGSLFEIDTGCCAEGPCAGRGLTALRVAVEDGEICLLGVDLVDD